MVTFKQLEAVYWVAKLGGFSQAAEHLHTTQSAVSRRVQELESVVDTQLFDRTLRTARLTEKGDEMFSVAQRLLAQRDEAMEQFARPEVVERRLRIGLTELTAMTWFPRLVSLVQAYYPRVVIEPDVDASVDLREKILADELDVAIVPEMAEDGRLSQKALGTIRNAWMCKPGALPKDKTFRIHEVASQRLLSQGDRSATGLAYDRWFRSFGLTPTNTLASNNLIAIIGMTISGLGLSHLPRECMMPLVDAGLLQIVKVSPALPEVTYVAMYKSEQRSSLIASVIMLAQECCDFSRAFQIGNDQETAKSV